MQTQAEMNLTGPTGQVYALAVGNELLFAATQVNFTFILLTFGPNIFIVESFTRDALGAGWTDFGLEIQRCNKWF
jgi:hypothetical protein